VPYAADAFLQRRHQGRRDDPRPRHDRPLGPPGHRRAGCPCWIWRRALGDGFDPGAAVALSVADLERAREAAGVAWQPGDILVLYTGFGRWYLAQDQAGREKAADERALTAAGVEHTEDMARYLWEQPRQRGGQRQPVGRGLAAGLEPPDPAVRVSCTAC